MWEEGCRVKKERGYLGSAESHIVLAKLKNIKSLVKHILLLIKEKKITGDYSLVNVHAFNVLTVL